MKTNLFPLVLAIVSVAVGSSSPAGAVSTRLDVPDGADQAAPLIFSLRSAQPLSALLSPQRGWVRPDTGILVQQAANSHGWRMLLRGAYASLASLDENGDGWLIGSELRGLGVWRDRNQNGVCDRGEVTSVATVGIEAISTRATSKAGDTLANPTGLFLKSGRTLPTYDWSSTPRL